MPSPLFRTTLAAAATVLFLSAGLQADAGETDVFMVRQEAPVLAHADLALAGASHGDMMAFQAKFTTDAGTAGVLNGLLITVDIADGELDVLEDRLGQLAFDFGNGDSILAGGQSVYPGTDHEMSADAPQLRAVTGGTGTYMGARGQITTTRNTDGSYEHMFELMD
jgi:hypothetical protein